MKRHVKENKAGMNSGTWNTAQKKITSRVVQETEGGFKMSTSVMWSGDTPWSRDQVTGPILPYLYTKISCVGHRDYIKHTPLNWKKKKKTTLGRTKSKDK